jgi:hypothetical protein
MTGNARGGKAAESQPEAILSTRQLNRALLARQLLLERASIAIPEALERIAGIQNQYAPNAYIRLWSCLAGFQRDALTDAYRLGDAVQGTLMRGTIHTVSARDYRLFAAAVRPGRREWARRAYRDPDADHDRVAERVRAALRGRSCARAELMSLLADASPAAAGTIDTDAELLRVPPSGTWERRRAHTFALAEDVLGPGEPPDETAAMRHLIARYLAAFGPASARDAAEFIGTGVSRLAPVLAGMELRRFRDEGGVELLDVPDGALPDAELPAPVRFLPTWDATLLVHARRTAILPEEYRPRIFSTKTPHSFNTFLVDGQVAGTWRHVDGRIEVEPFSRLTSSARREVDAEAEALLLLHRDERPRTARDRRGR